MTQVSVLVVDDDYLVADIHRRLVDSVPGCRVVGVANTGADAISLIAAQRPDLLLLDIYLPDLTGLDLLRRIRGDGESCDALVISAARDHHTVKTALGLGIVHFLIKPFAPETLTERLHQYVRFRRQINGGADRQLEQGEIDRAVHLMRPPATQLPKGVSAVTLGLITQALSDAPQSAAEVALRAGVSRVSARRYLEFLVTRGSVELTYRYGASGRPEHLYRRCRDA